MPAGAEKPINEVKILRNFYINSYSSSKRKIMTDPCVQFALAKLDAFLKRELQLPKKVDTGIRTLRSELDSIAAFLRKAHQRAVQDEQILDWVRKVQDAADDIIDILDLFDHHKAENGRAFSVTRRRAYRSIADQINDIKSTLEEINKGRERYQLANSSQAALPPSPTTNRVYSHLHPRIAPLFLADADVVGFEEDRDMLMAWALDMVDEHKVMFVVGMGGSGKTTLAKQVFEAVNKTSVALHGSVFQSPRRIWRSCGTC